MRQISKHKKIMWGIIILVVISSMAVYGYFQRKVNLIERDIQKIESNH